MLISDFSYLSLTDTKLPEPWLYQEPTWTSRKAVGIQFCLSSQSPWLYLDQRDQLLSPLRSSLSLPDPRHTIICSKTTALCGEKTSQHGRELWVPHPGKGSAPAPQSGQAGAVEHGIIDMRLALAPPCADITSYPIFLVKETEPQDYTNCSWQGWCWIQLDQTGSPPPCAQIYLNGGTPQKAHPHHPASCYVHLSITPHPDHHVLGYNGRWSSLLKFLLCCHLEFFTKNERHAQSLSGHHMWRQEWGGIRLLKRLSCGKDVCLSQPTRWSPQWLGKEESNHGDETESLGS